jgi:phosphatidylserine decarboxylase
VEKEGVLVMIWEVVGLGIALALSSLPLLGWKWRLDMRIVFSGSLVIGGIAGGLVLLIDYFLVDLSIIFVLLAELLLIFILVFICIAVRFYRDPERIPIETKNVILSPADGKVIYVNEIERGSSLTSTKGKRRFKLYEVMATDPPPNTAYLIGIDMNILNVHVNRSPIGGKIVLQKYIKGNFLSLRRPEAETCNERVTTIIDNGQFKIAMIQIASRLVRRIVSYLKEGDMVAIGQRIGMIAFGSQVDVAIPQLENLKITVKPGDRVRAGVSIVARHGLQECV